MRTFWAIFLSLPTVAGVYQTAISFDAARAVLEVRCLERHTPEKAKGERAAPR